MTGPVRFPGNLTPLASYRDFRFSSASTSITRRKRKKYQYRCSSSPPVSIRRRWPESLPRRRPSTHPPPGDLRVSDPILVPRAAGLFARIGKAASPATRGGGAEQEGEGVGQHRGNLCQGWRFHQAARAHQMASSTLKPGVPITLQELEPSSEMFKQGASLRVTGILQSYDVDSAVAVIRDGSATLKINTQHLRDISFRSGSMFQFIGELLIRPNDDAIMQARVGRNVDGLDLNLYQQSLIVRRQHEARLLSSRSA